MSDIQEKWEKYKGYYIVPRPIQFAADHPEIAGKWCADVEITSLEDGKIIKILKSYDLHDSEQEAFSEAMKLGKDEIDKCLS